MPGGGRRLTEEGLLIWTPKDGLAQSHENGRYSSLGTGGICQSNLGSRMFCLVDEEYPFLEGRMFTKRNRVR